jgi:hypothetical protein
MGCVGGKEASKKPETSDKPTETEAAGKKPTKEKADDQPEFVGHFCRAFNTQGPPRSQLLLLACASFVLFFSIFSTHPCLAF